MFEAVAATACVALAAYAVVQGVKTYRLARQKDRESAELIAAARARGELNWAVVNQ